MGWILQHYYARPERQSQRNRQSIAGNRKKQDKTDDLTARVTTRLKEAPGWPGGRALLAVINSQQGKTEEAKQVLEELVENQEQPAPGTAMWLIAVEIEKKQGTARPLH